MTKSDKNKLIIAIYFLKVDQLKSILLKRNLSTIGKKQELINRIFSICKIEPNNSAIQNFKIPTATKKQSQETHIIRGKYTNGKKSRDLFQKLIGAHFKFTTYGMNWIKECWAKGINPSYKNFADYWQNEYERRKSGGEFQSAPTNRRVIFFREHKGVDKLTLEKLWEKEQRKNTKLVLKILKDNNI